MAPLPVALVFLLCRWAALLCAARLIAATFSPKIRAQIRAHIVLHTILACFAFVGVLTFLNILTLNMWPPPFLDRRAQRAEIATRIQQAGGWSALQKDCNALTEQFRDSSFQWLRHDDTNILPHSLALLRPMEVRFYAPTIMGDFPEAPKVPVVQIQIFGLHRTGGRDIPYFGLVVICATNAGSYHPTPVRYGYQKVTDTIFEVY